MPRSAAEIVEEQVARWRLEIQQHSCPPSQASPVTRVPDVIVISSAYGSPGLSIAKAVADSLSFPIYNHEIVASIAEEAHVRVATVENLDETAEGSINDYLDALMRENSFSQSDYFRALSHAIIALWKHGPCVLVGHGANNLVPVQHRLAVRVTAPPETRCVAVAIAEDLDRHAARRKVQQQDARLESFMRRFFHAHVEDPFAYDLVLNTHHMTITDSATAVIAAYRRRFSTGNRAQACGEATISAS